ncbi:MAG: transglutaminase family protein [Flavobacterium sp.]|nr:transglutaminase family protein [Flavobacterium sp.]
MTFKVFSELSYQVYMPTTFLFNIEAAQTNWQTIIKEQLTTNIACPLEALVSPLGTRFIRTTINEPTDFIITYSATVTTHHQLIYEQLADTFTALSNIQPDVLPYLFSSRYCQSDKLQRFASQMFGNLVGDYAKVAAICDWIYSNIEYLLGSSKSYTSAVDTMSERAGVCRDFAHLGIALCRASGIPAKYFTGYAYQLQPADFHACFEAYINGVWLFFDATRMIPTNGLVKIANGLDAADTAVTNIFGSTFCNYITVSCNLVEDAIFKPFNAWENKEVALSYG